MFFEFEQEQKKSLEFFFMLQNSRHINKIKKKLKRKEEAVVRMAPIKSPSEIFIILDTVLREVPFQ